MLSDFAQQKTNPKSEMTHCRILSPPLMVPLTKLNGGLSRLYSAEDAV